MLRAYNARRTEIRNARVVRLEQSSRRSRQRVTVVGGASRSRTGCRSRA